MHTSTDFNMGWFGCNKIDDATTQQKFRSNILIIVLKLMEIEKYEQGFMIGLLKMLFVFLWESETDLQFQNEKSFSKLFFSSVRFSISFFFSVSLDLIFRHLFKTSLFSIRKRQLKKKSFLLWSKVSWSQLIQDRTQASHY